MRLPRYLLLLLLLSCAAAKCLGQLKKTPAKDEWRDLINTSLSGDSCKPADNPHGPGARICEGREGFSLRSEEHTSELQSLAYLVCRLLLEKKKKKTGSRI